MINLSRRSLLVGSGAAAITSVMPALAQAAIMPPVRTVKANGIDLAVHEAGADPAVVLLRGELPKGGRFAAWEQPELFADQVRELPSLMPRMSWKGAPTYQLTSPQRCEATN